MYVCVCFTIMLYTHRISMDSWSMCMYAWVYACMHVCVYACMHVCVYAWVYACMRVCMHVCMYACMHGYITHSHMYTCNTQTHQHTGPGWSHGADVCVCVCVCPYTHFDRIWLLLQSPCACIHGYMYMNTCTHVRPYAHRMVSKSQSVCIHVCITDKHVYTCTSIYIP